MAPMKRIAVVGAGPAGAIAVDALAQEKCFESIKVFERRERPGGCWYVPPLYKTHSNQVQYLKNAYGYD